MSFVCNWLTARTRRYVILDAIDARLDASRIFSFGVGSAPNRYLLERMAGVGRGAVAYLSLDASGSNVMNAFFDRIAHPAMIDVDIDWGGMQVADVYPRRLPNLWARLKIANLNDQLAVGPQNGERLSAEIRQTALAYSLMSDYTSFIAVDASEITKGGYGTTVYQSVPVPEGVRYDTEVAR